MNGRSCIDTGRGPPVEDWSGPGWHYFAKQVVNALIEVELGSYRRRPLDGFEARPSARPTGETRSGRFVAASARSAALPGRASDPAVAPLPSTAPRRLPSRRAPRAPRPGRTPRREALDAARGRSPAQPAPPPARRGWPATLRRPTGDRWCPGPPPLPEAGGRAR